MTNAKRESLIKLAEDLVGTPYKYGAKMSEAPDVFDCSGFIKYLYGEVGIDIPRSTIEQAEFAGQKVAGLENLKPGDLIFARGSRGHYNPTFPEGIGHVGVYIDKEKVIHAASKRIQDKPIIEKGQVIETSLEEFIKGWKPIVVIKRLINET